MQRDVVLSFTDREDFKGTLRSFMSPADQVAFERHYGMGIGKFQQEERVEWVLFLIWKAFAREQAHGLEFEVFVADLVEFDLPEEQPGPDPTETPPLG